MRRFPASGVLTAILVVTALICSATEPTASTPPPAQAAKVKVICGIFPVFLIAREILPSEHFELELLLPDSVGCSHHYSLTPGDMNRIASARAYISAGKRLEGFFRRIVREFPELKIIDCSEVKDFPAEIGSVEANGHLFSCLAGIEAMGKVLYEGVAAVCPEHREALKRRFQVFRENLAAKTRAFLQLGISGKKIPVAIIHNSMEFGLREVGFQIVEEIDSDGDHNTTLSPRELLQKIQSFREKGVRAIFYDTVSPPPVAGTLSQESRIPLIRWNSLSLRPVEVPVETFLDFSFEENLKMLKQLFSDERE